METLGITVSTGPVVAFRAKHFLLKQVKPGAVPLIHPLHFHLTHCRWPQENPKKPNGILKSEETEKMLFPSGYYCAVKRFSAKEEKRRITACVITPDDFPNMDYLGFENHLNVFHHHKKGIDKNLAFGLMVFLNSKMVDEFFRTFNGHTQVNAMDLKQILYPSTNSLTSLGIWAQSQDDLTLEKIDKKVEETLCKKMRMSI